MTGESVRSDAAVADTARQIVTYDGTPAVTYYFSTSGGQTENVEFSFIGSLSKPWLVSVPDPVRQPVALPPVDRALLGRASRPCPAAPRGRSSG